MYDTIVIGGGPAGLAAAYSAYEKGLGKVLIIERDQEFGGILNQCIHNGFGLHYFKEELTGPEYAARFIELLKKTEIEVKLDTTVLAIHEDKTVEMVSPGEGYRCLKSRSIILAMGCRERARGAIAIPGQRPAGIFTAGAAQRYLNIEGYLAGKRVVILGSGDIGLIMARRMTLEGAKVLACIELMPYSGGLTRNIVQCLEDYDIPLYLSHTVIDVQGDRRLEKVIAARVDESRRPIPGTEMEFDCDTLLLSVGLIPENELTRQTEIEMDSRTGGAVVADNMETSQKGIFACGNAVHVHDLVDFVTQESIHAGASAALFCQGACEDADFKEVEAGNGISYTVPQRIRKNGDGKVVSILFRVRRIFTNSTLFVQNQKGEIIASFPRERMAPGEMEKILLPRQKLDTAEKIFLSIQEAEK